MTIYFTTLIHCIETLHCIVSLMFDVLEEVTMKTKLSIYYQNVQGLRTKTDCFKSNVLSNDYDVLLICESWLTSNLEDAELFDNRYTVYRQDRDRDATGKKDGGGCLIAVKSKYYSSRIPEWELHKEDIWVSLDQLDGGKLYFNVRYIACRSTFDVYDMHLSKINEVINVIKPNATFMLVGDYNLADSITWIAGADGSCGAYDVVGNIADSFVDMLSLTNLNQYNTKRNVNRRTLDLVLSNVEPDKICICTDDDSLVPADRHHPPVTMLLDVTPIRFLDENRPPKFNFFRANYDEMNQRVSEIDWASELDGLNVDDSVERFYNLLSSLCDSVPKVRTAVKKYPCWYTRDLVKVLKAKVRARVKFMRTKNSADYAVFSNLRKEFKARQRMCEEVYISDIEDKVSVNTKAFFSYTKSLRKTNSVPSVVHYGPDSASDPDSVCNLFAKYFASVFNHSSYGEFVVSQMTPDLHISDVTLDEVRVLLSKLDRFKASSPDNVPSVFYKELSSTICLPLSILYNKSIREGVFPSAWKVSSVTPVYKSGKRSDVSNYRPISILAAASKVFERIVFNRVYEHVKCFITPAQHGFVTGKSTLTNLLEFVTRVTDSMLDGGQLDVIFTDFSKAFDRVSHSLLLLKLQNFGIKSNALRWFKSYLSGRTQRVVIGGGKSDVITTPSGVPQGSILGPLLFLLFINDLPDLFTSDSSLFADDNKIYRKIESAADGYCLQSDITSFSAWCDKNQLDLNQDKCCVLSMTCKPKPIDYQYHVKDKVIERVSSKKDLGIKFGCKGSFIEHISEMTKKSYQLIGFIFRTTIHFRRPESLIKLYNTYVRSRLEYCCTIWNPYYEKYKEQIEKVQRKFTRMLFYRFKWIKPDYQTRLRQLKMKSLETRRLELDEMALFKIIHGRIDTNLSSRVSIHQPIRHTRQNVHHLFYLSTPASNIQLNTPIYRMQNHHNEYFKSGDILRSTYNQYRRTVRNTYQF